MRKKLFFPLIVLGALLVLTACSSPTTRYLSHRLSPDRVPVKGVTQVTVPGISEEVKILLDEYGVPHIRANNSYDLFFAFGYMQGRDRRFQLEVLRKLSAGRMRELIGDKDETGVMKRLEIFSRAVGLQMDAQALLDSLDKKDRLVMDAFTDGVNAATVNEPVPFEFKLLDYDPEPWTTFDSAVVIAMISFGLCKNWEMELIRLEMMVYQLQTGGSIERALEIYKPRMYWPPYLIGQAPEKDPFADIPVVPPELRSFLEARYGNKKTGGFKKSELIEKPVQEAYFPLADFFKGIDASNNWAMSGKWTKTGKGAFSSDPHMPHMMPSLCYLATLECDNCEDGNFQISGGAFVGLPAIACGTNGKVTWGPTSNWADIKDLYVEKLAPGKPDHYLHNGKAIPFKVRKEEFKIRQEDGSFQTETVLVRETRHGIVLNDFIERLPEDFPIVVMKRDTNVGHPITALRELYRSSNVTEAREAMKEFAAMVGHWSIADDQGNIAYTGTVNLPRRTKHLGVIPVPGWQDTYEWESFVSMDDLPYVENPKQGWVGTANSQVVQPDSTGYPINFEGNVPFRFRSISKFLTAGNTGAPIVDQIGKQQLNNLDEGWLHVRETFKPALVALQKNEDETVAKGATMLLEWDGESGPDSVPCSLYNSLNAYLLSEVIKDEVSEKTHEFIMGYFNIDPMVFSVLGDAKNPAWDNRNTKEIETANQVITKCFIASINDMKERWGDNIEDWTWNTVAPFEIPHAFGGQKALKKYVNRTAPTMGANNTVNKHQPERDKMVYFPIKHGPVLRVMVDLNDLPASKMSLPGGQSGRPSSKNYDDQLPLFVKGDGITMDLDFANAEKRAVGTVILKPAK